MVFDVICNTFAPLLKFVVTGHNITPCMTFSRSRRVLLPEGRSTPDHQTLASHTDFLKWIPSTNKLAVQLIRTGRGNRVDYKIGGVCNSRGSTLEQDIFGGLLLHSYAESFPLQIHSLTLPEFSVSRTKNRNVAEFCPILCLEFCLVLSCLKT